MPDNQEFEARLDKAIEEIRQETIDEATVRQAAARVWEKVSPELPGHLVEAIHGCEDFQALLPAYRAGELPEARRLLVRDHLQECISCRKAFMRDSAGTAPAPVTTRRRFQPPKWAIAAGLILAAGLSSLQLYEWFGPPPSGPAATVQAVEGTLYRLDPGETVEMAPGDALEAGDLVRAARDSAAIVRLRDGSLVEVRERSSFSIRESRRDVTIRMARGSVIVEAAQRASGHLYVSTRDCRVAVTGTVFSVNSGVKGSRVAVMEGEVRVAQGSRKRVLRPGEQYASSPAMTPVSLEDEIAWSQKAEEHLALLKELAALGEQMEQQVWLPAARYSSRLLGYLPADTAFYAALPNLGETVADAYVVLRDRMQQSPALRDWWNRQMGADSETKAQAMVEQVRLLSSYLGDEIVIAASLNAEGKLGDPVILAETGQADGLTAVAGQLDGWNDGSLAVFRDAASIPFSDGEGAYLYAANGVAAVSGDAAALRQVAESVEGAGGAAGNTEFRQRVEAAYAQGAGLLLCVDLERVAAREQGAQILGNVKYLIAGQKQIGGVPDSRAEVTFAGPREGIAAWLAAPSPIGALDFISPEATLVTAFAIRQPAEVIEDVLAIVPAGQEELAKAEEKLGFRIKDDLAAAFGSEFAVALDGPALPRPAWKVVAEVYNPAKLEWTIQKLVEAVNQEAAAAGQPLLETTEVTADGRTYRALQVPSEGPAREFHYVFVDGYLIAAPSRALLDKAVDCRASGNLLVSTAKFAAMLPRDGHANFSAMVYHDMGAALGALSGVLTPEQQTQLQDLSEPMLVLAYGEENRITAASTSEAFGFTPGNLFGLRTPMGLGALFGGKHGHPDEPQQE